MMLRSIDPQQLQQLLEERRLEIAVEQDDKEKSWWKKIRQIKKDLHLEDPFILLIERTLKMNKN
ncbi:hypothetical protein [Bacillus sp. FSL K6-3431]|uniref:hypothetical protein n=1 Tax=Bacillus sp. FSL K6-3431 TaxID=2921500 RepID=UPI0030FBF2C3